MAEIQPLSSIKFNCERILRPSTPMEKFRNKLRPREWGEPVCTLPYTGGARPPIDHVRENISVPIAVSGSDPLGPTHPSPIPLPMISTKGWTLDSLINKSLNFHHVRRVPASSSSLPQIINDHENSGVPLVIEDCHKHPSWPKEEFTLDSFASTTSNGYFYLSIKIYQC